MAKGKRNGAGKRRGRRSKTVDKADTVETRTVSSQTNLKLTEARQKQHMETIKGYDQMVNKYTGKRRKALEAIKAEGYNLDALRDLIKAEKTDPLEQRDYMQQYSMGLPTIGVPYRVSVYDATYKNPVEQAKAEGRAQAQAGRAAEPRSPEGTPEHEAYMEAYSKKQAELSPGGDLLSDAERGSAVQEGLEARH